MKRNNKLNSTGHKLPKLKCDIISLSTSAKVKSYYKTIILPFFASYTILLADDIKSNPK